MGLIRIRKRRNKIVDSTGNATSHEAELKNSNRPHNVVSALYQHFQKWKPEVVTKVNKDGLINLEVQE
jgi:hypothetical protein